MTSYLITENAIRYLSGSKQFENNFLIFNFDTFFEHSLNNSENKKIIYYGLK